MSSPLVAGLGHPDRGDDAVGLLVAEAVRAARPRLDVRLLTDPLALIELLPQRDLAVVVDAAVTENPTGTIRLLDATDSALPLPRHGAASSSHGISLGDVLELARTMGNAPARLVVVTISADAFELGERPQPAVLASVEQACAHVLSLADEVLSEPLPPTGRGS